MQGPALRNRRAINWRVAVTLGLFICWGVAACTPDNRPVVFNHLSEQLPNRGSLVRQHFAKQYRIIDVDDSKQRFTPPKYLGGLEGRRPLAGTDACLPENARILFVVTTEGAVAAPQVIATSGTLSSQLAIEKLEKMRFQPATLDGKPVPALVDFELGLNCPTGFGHRR